MRQQPIYMLTIEFKGTRKPLNVALGPNQKTLYEIGDKEYGGRKDVAKVSVERVHVAPRRHR